MLKHFEIPITWIVLSCVIATPIAFLPAFADDSTTTSIISSQNPSTFGQPITITVAVSPSNATGIVFLNDTSTVPPTILDTAAISGGLTSFSISSLSVGSHDIDAVYVGDANYLPSTSPVLIQTINKINTTINILSSVNPSAFGQSVNFTAIVIPPSSELTPTGTIQFLVNGSVTGGPITLIGGNASLDLSSLSVGVHSVSAIYSGDTIFESGSGSFVQTINQINSSILLSSNSTTISFGSPITLTATISPSTANGTVQFQVNGTNLNAPVTLSGEQAILSTISLPVGTDVISAVYSGDDHTESSTSNSVTISVISFSPSVSSTNKVDGKGKFGKGINFEFKIDPKDGHIKGNLNYHDKNSKFNLHGTKITTLSVDDSMTQISFTGQAKTHGESHDNKGQLTFSVNISDIDNKKSKQFQFSITVTDDSGNIVYQKSGQATGHINIHKEKPPKPEQPHTQSQTNDGDDDDSKPNDKHAINTNLTNSTSLDHKKPSKHNK